MLFSSLLRSSSLPMEGSPMLSTSEYVKSGGRGHLLHHKIQHHESINAGKQHL